MHKNSQTSDLLHRFTEKHIKKTWIKHGMYKGSDILDCNPHVLQYVAKKKGWKRPLPGFLALAAQTGNWKITENYYIDEKDK